MCASKNDFRRFRKSSNRPRRAYASRFDCSNPRARSCCSWCVAIWTSISPNRSSKKTRKASNARAASNRDFAPACQSVKSCRSIRALMNWAYSPALGGGPLVKAFYSQASESFIVPLARKPFQFSEPIRLHATMRNQGRQPRHDVQPILDDRHPSPIGRFLRQNALG
jgi:hypothetical protein